MTDLTKKWDGRYQDADIAEGCPALVLSENTHLLPHRGKALEVACGLGANALLLANQGLDTTAWDVSEVVIDKLWSFAKNNRIRLHVETRDVVMFPPIRNSFDVIVVSRFLERRLAPVLVAALKPSGLLFYQTFIQDAVHNQGPGNPAYRLHPNELLNMFASLRLLLYREEATVGDVTRGFRNEAMFVGLK